MATKPILVVTLSRKMLIFGDEALSRRHFEPKNSFFGDETLSRHHFKPENSLFGDETLSRRHFLAGNFTFWRRGLFSSSF
ncbi:hypothetical protein [Caldifermentibacillus hisashii]|uniref:hypothetical protein n=1 Tax=Caldifermentibacillus hisashii TaxID=996558 RepID=UPI0031013D41